MIIEWFLAQFATFADWILGLMESSTELTTFLGNASTVIQDALDNANGLGAWVDWTYLFLVTGIVTVVWLAGLIIKAARWLLGLLPTMGGGT